MSKPRAAALLGGLTMVGLLVLSGLLGAAGQASPFQQLKGALGRGCLQYATVEVPGGSQEIFRAACSFMASTLRVVPNDQAPELDQALLGAFREETPGLASGISCNQCLQSVQDFESYLATNGTSQGIEGALELGCQKRFKSTQLTECLQNVAGANIPQLIDYALANYPPPTACQQLQFCP